VAATTLLEAARRELRSFEEHDRDKADAADAAYGMTAYLRDEGYAHARVEFELLPDRLRFKVNEGPRATLGTLTFSGIRAFTKEEFSPLFDFPGTGALGTGDPLFVANRIDAAVTKLERFYLLRGFYRVRIEITDVDWREDLRQADVTITVEEGIRYSVAAVEFEGIAPMDLGLIGKPYNVRLPVEAAAQIRRRLLDDGRQRCDVDQDAEVDDATGQVTLRFEVDAGPQVRVGELRFDGEIRTRDRFLRRRALLREGDLLAQELLDRAVSELYGTGLFSLVRPRLEDAGNDRSDVAFEIEEMLARSVDFEVGYGSYELLRGAVRYTDRNLLGIGRTLTTELSGSVRGGGAEVGITDPYILGAHYVLELGTGYLFRQEPSFDLESYHADVLVRRRIGRVWTLRAGYRFRDERATNVKVPIDEEAEGFIRTAGLTFGVTRDTRDSAYLPVAGSRTDVGVLWSSPTLGAELDFVELDVQWTRFLPLWSGAVFGVGGRFRGRYILDDRTDLPIEERFFLGGATTIRSFYEDDLGPTDGGQPRGGLTAVEGSAELRQRLWRELHGAFFVDYGTLDVEGFSFHAPPGWGVGLGLRYYLPVGPIRVDVGYNPGLMYAADSRWAFHLAFGFSF